MTPATTTTAAISAISHMRRIGMVVEALAAGDEAVEAVSGCAIARPESVSRFRRFRSVRSSPALW